MAGEVRHKNLIGHKFGRLTVIAKSHKDTSNSIIWGCECTCGRHIKVSSANLNRGKAKSCGICVRRNTSNGTIKDGDAFGRWVVIKADYSIKEGNSYCWCKCSCGTEREVHSVRLLKGTSLSCGCLQKETVAQRSTIHGDYLNRLYHIWSSMRQRCINPNVKGYKNYGGRGIQVYAEWEDYTEFKKWALNNGYSDELTIERIDVNGNYTPDNVTFISAFDQHSNRRDNVIVSYKNINYTISQLGRATNIPTNTLRCWNKYKKHIFELLVEERIKQNADE